MAVFVSSKTWLYKQGSFVGPFNILRLLTVVYGTRCCCHCGTVVHCAVPKQYTMVYCSTVYLRSVAPCPETWKFTSFDTARVPSRHIKSSRVDCDVLCDTFFCFVFVDALKNSNNNHQKARTRRSADRQVVKLAAFQAGLLSASRFPGGGVTRDDARLIEKIQHETPYSST